MSGITTNSWSRNYEVSFPKTNLSVFCVSLLLHLLECFVFDATAAQWTKLLTEWKILV